MLDQHEGAIVDRPFVYTEKVLVLEVVNFLTRPCQPIELGGATYQLVESPGMTGPVWIDRD